jgi:hypothetical protein
MTSSSGSAKMMELAGEAFTPYQLVNHIPLAAITVRDSFKGEKALKSIFTWL